MTLIWASNHVKWQNKVDIPIWPICTVDKWQYLWILDKKPWSNTQKDHNYRIRKWGGPVKYWFIGIVESDWNLAYMDDMGCWDIDLGSSESVFLAWKARSDLSWFNFGTDLLWPFTIFVQLDLECAKYKSDWPGDTLTAPLQPVNW